MIIPHPDGTPNSWIDDGQPGVSRETDHPTLPPSATRTLKVLFWLAGEGRRGYRLAREQPDSFVLGIIFGFTIFGGIFIYVSV